jgi:hypothetical protein
MTNDDPTGVSYIQPQYKKSYFSISVDIKIFTHKIVLLGY